MEKRAMTIVFRACVVMTVFVVSAVAINAQTLNNGGFEIGGGPYTNPATSLISTAAVSWVQFANGLRTSTNDTGSANTAHSGAWSLKCFGSTTWDGEGAYQVISNGVSANQQWVLSGYGMNPSSDPLTNEAPLGGTQPFGDLILEFFNSTNSNANATLSTEVHVPATTPYDTWLSISTTGTAPAGTILIKVYAMELGFGAASVGSVFFDDINLVNLNAPIITNLYHETIIGGNQICWFTSTNANYQPQSSPNNVTWSNVGGLIPGDGTTNCTFDAIGLPSTRFYRVLELK
jgi:hypothetical protein